MPKPRFETALQKLETIVEELEGSDLALDEALKKFEEGIKLSKICQRQLNETEQKVAALIDEAQEERMADNQRSD